MPLKAFTDLKAIVEDALPVLDGAFDLYELQAGALNVSNITVPFTYPAYFITNITGGHTLTSEELLANMSTTHLDVADVFLNKEPFVGGVVALSFVLSGIVTAGWMLLLLLLLSANSIPNSLMLLSLFFCAGHTVMLTKLTAILEQQVHSDFSDTRNIMYYITFATDITVVRCITWLLVWVSWIDLLIQINKYTRRKQILYYGGALSLISFTFAVTYSILYRYKSENRHYTAIKVVHYVCEYLIVTLFDLQVLRYTVEKRQFAYHRKAMALAVFTLCTLLTPYVFLTIDLASDSLGTWATYVLTFAKLCCTIVTWEWLHTIRSLQLKYEKKAVLGRRISYVNFAEITGVDPGEQPHSYILKSTNIVRLLSWVNPLKWICGDAKKDAPQVEVISLQTGPQLSRRPSNISQNSAISIVADHPRFDVDHQYLRATPSTIEHQRYTPSNAGQTPVIPEDDEQR